MSARICSKGVEMESCLKYRTGKCCDEAEMKKMDARKEEEEVKGKMSLFQKVLVWYARHSNVNRYA
jgi:hypothetical protein